MVSSSGCTRKNHRWLTMSSLYRPFHHQLAFRTICHLVHQQPLVCLLILTCFDYCNSILAPSLLLKFRSPVSVHPQLFHPTTGKSTERLSYINYVRDMLWWLPIDKKMEFKMYLKMTPVQLSLCSAACADMQEPSYQTQTIMSFTVFDSPFSIVFLTHTYRWICLC